MVDLGGWRSCFLGRPPIGVAALAHGRRWPAGRRRPGSPAGPTCSDSRSRSPAVGALALGRRPGPGLGLGRSAHDRRVRASARGARAAAGLALRAASGAGARAPLFRSRTLQRGQRRRRCCSARASSGSCSRTRSYLTQVWGYSVLQAGLAIAPGPLASAVAAIVAARFTDRIDPRRFSSRARWSARWRPCGWRRRSGRSPRSWRMAARDDC